jgi:hypothetical protein
MVNPVPPLRAHLKALALTHRCRGGILYSAPGGADLNGKSHLLHESVFCLLPCIGQHSFKTARNTSANGSKCLNRNRSNVWNFYMFSENSLMRNRIARARETIR